MKSSQSPDSDFEMILIQLPVVMTVNVMITLSTDNCSDENDDNDNCNDDDDDNCYDDDDDEDEDDVLLKNVVIWSHLVNSALYPAVSGRTESWPSL